VSQTGTLAFLVHPRARLSEDMARVSKPLGLLPERVYDVALRRLPVPPVTMASVHLGAKQVGHIVLVPFGARHMLAQPTEARARVDRAVDHAVGLGATVVGLGALTAPVTGGGVSLRSRTDIAVTNGNAFTAAVVHDQVRELLQSSPSGRVAIVGATGSVGTTVAKLVVRHRDADELLLVARNERRLDSLNCNLSGRGVAVRSTTDLHAVHSADLVVLLTAAAGSVLEPKHLADGAVVLDATQPRNTTTDLARARRDVRILDGGIVSIPSLEIRGGNVGLPNGRAYACFAETALLALFGHRGHFSIGIPDLEQVEHVRSLARDFAHLGFTVAAPTSFGVPVRPASSAVAPMFEAVEGSEAVEDIEAVA
jgi:fatty aldehyde-generating acyl-ACP reductase